MRRALLLWCAIWLTNAPSKLVQSHEMSPRPVRNVTETPDASSIEFVSFDFQEPGLYHAFSVDYRAIKGEPSAGAEYGVKASLDKYEAIATLSFEVVDDTGKEVQAIPMVYRSTGVPGDVEFIGALTVPSHPFRVRIRGEDIDGRGFTLVSTRLFKPRFENPAEDPVSPALGGDFVQLVQQLLADARAERHALAAENPSGRIVMPRTRVSNVTYSPFISPSGQPIGIHVTYDVEFSQAGRYNPELRVLAEGHDDSSLARYPLQPLQSTIKPVPRETHAPYGEAATIPVLLAHRADFLYETGITYKFALDLVPDFVQMHRNTTIPCLSVKGSRYDSVASRAAFARMLARDSPTTYLVFIGRTAFQGHVDNFDGVGTFYRGLMADGLTECEKVPEHDHE